AAPSAKGDDKFITTDYLQQCPEYRYNELYKFGDRAAKIAIDFKRAWSFSTTCSGVDEVAEITEDDYQEFWSDFFGNPLFYEDAR
ncbi:hypothetical protein, partial [Escherichia coli]